ncbi:unnamed protein product [Camellia sinensis]
MDWNAKWDWENLITFNSKTVESPKKQPTDWEIGEGEIDAVSFNLSGGGAVGSSSDLAHGSSARSSVSASMDSSSKEISKMSKIAVEAFHDFPEDFGKKNELARTELAGTSLPLEPSVGSGELLIGLKLGKRTYFENNYAGDNAKTSSLSVIPVSSAASTAKKIKSSSQTHRQRCQVEGCNLDLSSAKEYHRKHRVCESHSKCAKVVVCGLERRFCQQCSRFHNLSEFDEKKRSCRKRLSDHNARRRKPQQDAIQFDSSMLLSSPFLDGKQQMCFALNNTPLLRTRSSANPTWESACSSKYFTLTKGHLSRSGNTGGIDGQPQLPGIELPHSISMLGQNTRAEIFTRGPKESMLSSNLDAVPNLHRALSLLSTDSWGSESPNIIPDHPIQRNFTSMPQFAMLPQGLPLTSSEYWQSEWSTDSRRAHSLTTNDSGYFQGIKVFKSSNLLN